MPLEPSPEQRRALTDDVVGFVDEWLERRPDAPASWDPPDDGLIEMLLRPPSDEGRDLGPLLEAVGRATDTGIDTAGGGFLSYIPSGGLYTAALGALVGGATNQYTGGAHGSPGMTAIEESVIRWMTGVFGLPTGSAGVLVSGGSIANLIAVVTARSRLGDDFAGGVVYTSERVHHSVPKAARIAGIADRRVRTVATDHRHRLDPRALEATVRADVAEGLGPMLVVANAGTTDTGAIDSLDACADIATEAGAWFHVDAAYGGFFQLTDRGRRRLRGIERADSITVDAHKSLFLPFGIGGLLVRDPAAVAAAHAGAGAYLQDATDAGLPHYWEMGPELTRPNRGIQVWLALNLHGVTRFRSELDRMLDLAETAATRLAAIPGVEVLAEPELTVVAFRATAGDAATRGVADALVASRRVHVSTTTIDRRLCVRLVFLSQRTSHDIVDQAIEVIGTTLADATTA